MKWIGCRPCPSNLPVWLRTHCHKGQTGECDAEGTDVVQKEAGMGSQFPQGKLGNHLEEMTVCQTLNGMVLLFLGMAQS